MSKITYTDKVTSNPQPSIPVINKVTGDDMTEIKTVVNDNDTVTTAHIANTSNPHNTTAAAVGALASGDNVSELANDAGYLTSVTPAPVDSVNAKTGVVILDGTDIPLLTGTTTPTITQSIATKEEVLTDVTKTASFSPSGDDSINFICDSAIAIVVTFDTGALTATNKEMSFFHKGSGALTFINGTGTLVGNAGTSFVSEGQFSTIYVKRLVDGTYLLYGQTA